MSKKYILALFLILCINEFLYSQITIGKIEKQKDTAILRPSPYDSLKNFENFNPDDFYQYKKYIGLKFYLPPLSNARKGYRDEGINFLYSATPSIIDTSINIVDPGGGYEYDNESKKYKHHTYNYNKIKTYIYKPFIFNFGCGVSPFIQISSDSAKVCNKYYTLLNILYEDILKNLKENIYQTNKSYDNYNSYKKNRDCNVMFLLRNDSTKDSLYCEDLSKFTLVPYFIKQNQLYQNKTLVCIDSRSYKEGTWWKDIKTDKDVTIYPDSKWYCSEVTLLKSKGLREEEGGIWRDDTSEYRLNYLLKNDLGETIAITNFELRYGVKFITKDEYDKNELKKKLTQEQINARKKQEEFQYSENQRKAQEKRKAECISKYGQSYGELISEGKVEIGMWEEMCKDSWGDPFDSYKTTTTDGVYEDWYYGWKYRLHFVNGTLKRIEN